MTVQRVYDLKGVLWAPPFYFGAAESRDDARHHYLAELRLRHVQDRPPCARFSRCANSQRMRAKSTSGARAWTRATTAAKETSMLISRLNQHQAASIALA